ncbi:MAG TPA: hypothetical protein VF475_12190 [Sphingobium sp.]
MGLQLVRASHLTMTRLQLALQSGDRRLALSAMDGLLDIDAEMEGFVADLVGSAPDNPYGDAHWQALGGYLAQQKAAIAVEKHALVGMSGRVAPPQPMVAIEEFPAAPPPAELPEAEDEDHQPRRWWPGLILALLCLGLLAALGVVFGPRWI